MVRQQSTGNTKALYSLCFDKNKIPRMIIFEYTKIVKNKFIMPEYSVTIRSSLYNSESFAFLSQLSFRFQWYFRPKKKKIVRRQYYTRINKHFSFVRNRQQNHLLLNSALIPGHKLYVSGIKYSNQNSISILNA